MKKLILATIGIASLSMWCGAEIVDVFPLKVSGGRIELHSDDSTSSLVWRDPDGERKKLHDLEYPIQSMILESPGGGAFAYLTGSTSAGTWPVLVDLKTDGFPVKLPLGNDKGEGPFAAMKEARAAKLTSWSTEDPPTHIYSKISRWTENGDLVIRVTADGGLKDFGFIVPAGVEKPRPCSSKDLPETDLGGESVVSAFADIQSTGTGFFVNSDGLLATSLHLVDEALRVRVEYNGSSYEADGAGFSREHDLHLLKIKVPGPTPYLPVSQGSGYLLGQKCFTIGYPLTSIQGFTPKFTEGSISATSGLDDSPLQLQISVPVQAGNSGGPLVSEAGEVLGVIQSRLSNAGTVELTGDLPQNVNYAVKADYLQKLAASSIPSPKEQKKLTRDEAIAAAQAATVRIIVYQ